MSNTTLNLILASDQPVLFKKLLKKNNIDYIELLYYLLRNRSTKVAKNAGIIKYIYTLAKLNEKTKSSLLVTASKYSLTELVKLLLPGLENYYRFY